MNSVKYEGHIITNVYKEGDIFERKNEAYMLTFTDGLYSLINLGCGISWNGFKNTIKEAIDGATFIGRDMNITISK